MLEVKLQPASGPTARSAAPGSMAPVIGAPVRGSIGRPNRCNAACRVVPSTRPTSAYVWPAARARATVARKLSSTLCAAPCLARNAIGSRPVQHEKRKVARGGQA